jgi:hypothetical protein
MQHTFGSSFHVKKKPTIVTPAATAYLATTPGNLFESRSQGKLDNLNLKRRIPTRTTFRTNYEPVYM